MICTTPSISRSALVLAYALLHARDGPVARGSTATGEAYTSRSIAEHGWEQPARGDARQGDRLADGLPMDCLEFILGPEGVSCSFRCGVGLFLSPFLPRRAYMYKHKYRDCPMDHPFEELIQSTILPALLRRFPPACLSPSSV